MRESIGIAKAISIVVLKTQTLTMWTMPHPNS